MNDIRELVDLDAPGVVKLSETIRNVDLVPVRQELADPERVHWRNEHRIVQGDTRDIHQKYDNWVVTRSDKNSQALHERIPSILNLTQMVLRYIQSGEIVSLHRWDPAEITAQRYVDTGLGISAHKDSRRYIGVVAVVTVEGEGDLEVQHNKEIITYPTQPGNIVLLRAPWLVPTTTDIRPLHRVVRVQPPRISLTYRMLGPRGLILPGMENIGDPLAI